MGVPLSLGSLGEKCLNTRLVEFSGGGAGSGCGICCQGGTQSAKEVATSGKGSAGSSKSDIFNFEIPLFLLRGRRGVVFATFVALGTVAA
jgi:hypothetical protein